jgi:hypothetical protein
MGFLILRDSETTHGFIESNWAIFQAEQGQPSCQHPRLSTHARELCLYCTYRLTSVWRAMVGQMHWPHVGRLQGQEDGLGRQ